MAFIVAIDMDDPKRRAVPGVVGHTKHRNVKFGVYYFRADHWEWSAQAPDMEPETPAETPKL